VLVSAADVNGNVSTQMLTVTVLNVDEIARKLDQIGGQLRTGLRAYAVHGLSDMLSFNESMMRGHNDDLCSDRKVFSGFARGDENGGSVDLQYSRRLAECSRRHQVRVDAGLSYSKIEGDWNSRIFAGLRYETKIDQDFTLGLAALASQSSDKLIGFEQSSISDKSLQATAYGRYWISDTLRTGAFFGFGKTWYNFSLIDSDDFSLAGSMRGNRQLYGWLMSGEWVIGDTVLTTDAIISHAKEKLGSASLSANYMGEKRTNIDLAVGTVDVTRISLPVTAPVVLSGSSEEYGEFSRLLLSPGVICEDNSADSSSMRCGYQAGAKLIVKDDSGRNHFYADYRWENVSGIQRSLFGVGYAYRFGRRNELELAIDLNRAQDNEDRAFVSLRLAQ